MTEFQAIRIDEFLPYAPTHVWKALTDSELLAKWLMQSDFEPKLGHQFIFKTDPIPAANFDGIIRCRVLEIEPERKLKITWGEGGLDTTLLWELLPEGAGTRLSMVHDGFDPKNPMHQFAYHSMGDGWRTEIFPRLAELLAEEAAQTA